MYYIALVPGLHEVVLDSVFWAKDEINLLESLEHGEHYTNYYRNQVKSIVYALKYIITTT